MFHGTQVCMCSLFARLRRDSCVLAVPLVCCKEQGCAGKASISFLGALIGLHDRVSASSLRILCPEQEVQLYVSFSEIQCDEHWTSVHKASSHMSTVALLGIPVSPSSVHLRRCFQV